MQQSCGLSRSGGVANEKSNGISGWNECVKPYQAESKFWFGVWQTAFPTWGSCHLGNCYLGKCTFGKLPLGKLHIWEVAAWENTLGKLPLGKRPLGKYLT